MLRVRRRGRGGRRLRAPGVVLARTRSGRAVEALDDLLDLVVRVARVAERVFVRLQDGATRLLRRLRAHGAPDHWHRVCRETGDATASARFREY